MGRIEDFLNDCDPQGWFTSGAVAKILGYTPGHIRESADRYLTEENGYWKNLKTGQRRFTPEAVLALAKRMKIMPQYPEYEDIKPGDLLVSEDPAYSAVVIGTPTPEGILKGILPEPVEPGILCFKKSGSESYFQSLDQYGWNRGVNEHHKPRDTNPELSKSLLEEALNMIDSRNIKIEVEFDKLMDYQRARADILALLGR